MSNLIKIIIEIFKQYIENTSVIQKDRKYTYKDILHQSLVFSKELNNLSDTSLRIGLIATNSVNWIVAFFAVLFSKHRLVLFSNNMESSKIRHVIIDSRIAILITDKLNEYDLSEIITYFPIDVSESLMKLSDNNSEEVIDLIKTDYSIVEPVDSSIIIYTPRSLKKVFISHEKILNTLKTLDSKNVFTDNNIYIAYPEFTYNYVLGFLLPFLHGVTIVIPEIDEDVYGMKQNFIKNQPEVVTLNARQFEVFYREYIENLTDSYNEILRFLRLNFIRSHYLKRKFKKVFPSLKKLIILNSQINPKIENTLKKLKIPYMITYGNVENCGYIHSDSTTEFKNLKIDISSTDQMEEVLRNLPYVDDCIVIKRNDKFYLIAKLDINSLQYFAMTKDDATIALINYIKDLNSKISSFEQISNIVTTLSDFRRDGYGRIIKEYYQ